MGLDQIIWRMPKDKLSLGDLKDRIAAYNLSTYNAYLVYSGCVKEQSEFTEDIFFRIDDKYEYHEVSEDEFYSKLTDKYLGDLGLDVHSDYRKDYDLDKRVQVTYFKTLSVAEVQEFKRMYDLGWFMVVLTKDMDLGLELDFENYNYIYEHT